MNIENAIIYSICVLSLGCRVKDAKSGDNNEHHITSGDIYSIVRDAPACNNNPSHSLCEMVDYSSDNTKFDPSAHHSTRILIVDSASALGSSLRVRKMIKNRYTINNDGSYAESSISASIPRGLATIWESLERNEQSLTPELYQELRDAAETKFMSAISFPYDHANSIIDIISQYTPDSALILADLPNVQNLICESNVEGVKEYLSKASQNLKTIASSQEVEFINLSAGFSKKTLEKDIWQGYCQKSQRMPPEISQAILKLQTGFIRNLSNLEGILLVQAGVSLKSEDQANSDFAPSDCVTDGFLNRLRVGGYNSQDFKATPDGKRLSDHLSILSATQKNAEKCTDLYVNSGLEKSFPYSPGEHFVAITNTGLGTYPIPFFPTSTAAPVALSYLVHFKHTKYGEQQMTNHEVAEIMQHFRSSKLLLDPVRYNQFIKFD